ncbi:hypothetical protein NPIL_674431 [Nephila pilipes]|uniref:Uncharacterized protein n=1 Tax=Nephila pilipes TaxID=299642 RepID=A0A8X6MGM5_NEPPI|nr:hypothetical protein NPIL_674431 [Nephila pilipes]
MIQSSRPSLFLSSLISLKIRCVARLEQEAMSMSLEAARTFIRRCQTELKWDNLPNVTVMDVGCGYFLECCTALLEQFPDVEKLQYRDKGFTTRVRGKDKQNCVQEYSTANTEQGVSFGKHVSYA